MSTPVAGLELAPALAVQNLSITYQSRHGQVEALQAVSFSLRPGEFVSFIGPSGCGKSTLLNAIAGLRRSGVSAHGAIQRPLGQTLGYLFQRQTLLPWRTVVENVEVPLEIRRVPKAERRARALAMLERYGLRGFEHRYPSELSGGMRQRVLLIRTLIYEPDVVLLDEPLSSLDAQTRILLQDELLRLWRDTHKTFVLVTHDLEEAIALSQRVFLISARPGRLAQEFRIELPDDRSALAIRSSPAFQAVQQRIWSHLSQQVLEQHRVAQPHDTPPNNGSWLWRRLDRFWRRGEVAEA